MLRLLLHSYGQFDARHPITPVVWPHFDLLYVHTGRLELQVGDTPAFQVKGGEGALIYPDTPFAGRARTVRVQASVQHFALEKTSAQKNAVLRALAERTRGCAWWRGEGTARDVERAMALATLPADDVTTAMREAQLLLILGAILQGESSADATRGVNASTSTGAESLQQVVAWARQRAGVLTARELAQRAGYSRGHFRALFGKTFEARPASYLRSLKMNEAKRRLRESRQPIKDIARETGYSDVVAFHRAFVRDTRHTPAEYRRRFSPKG